jgi:hypothetical protein
MTSTTLKDNGRLPRKTLASQLDRLDQILDGLAESLNDAVAQAVKDAVGLAIRGVLTEVLANPELLAKLRPEPATPAVPPPSPIKGPGWLSWLAGVGKGACVKVCNLTRQACGKVVRLAHRAWQPVSACLTKVSNRVKTLARGFWALLCGAAGVAWQARQPLLIALCVGTALGLGCYLAGPVVSSAVSGFAGFVSSLVASAVNSLRHALLCFDLQDA